MRVFLVLVLALAACSSAPRIEHKQARQVDLKLEKYVQRFEKIYGRAIEYSVTFGDMGRNYAVCLKSKNRSSWLVLVDEKKWPTYSAEAKQVLVFHELGHCVLNRRHWNEIDSNGGPTSIMNDLNIGDTLEYRLNRESYIEELFKNVSGHYLLDEDREND